MKGAVKEKWGELTDDDWTRAEGKVDKLSGILQEKYGHGKADVERELDRIFHRDDKQ
jgi:uncharacterized protein YjbJ (UPF0337 family)